MAVWALQQQLLVMQLAPMVVQLYCLQQQQQL
jgi:hypothetical protein